MNIDSPFSSVCSFTVCLSICCFVISLLSIYIYTFVYAEALRYHVLFCIDENTSKYPSLCVLFMYNSITIQIWSLSYFCRTIMALRSTAREVYQCDLCETAILHSYRDFCDVNIYKPCVEDHISIGYDKHKIIPFNEQRSTLIYSKCRTHPGKSWELQYKICDNLMQKLYTSQR